jgi:hypothetical protein
VVGLSTHSFLVLRMAEPCKRQKSQAASFSTGMAASEQPTPLQPVVGEDSDRADSDIAWDDIFDDNAELDQLQRCSAHMVSSDEGDSTPMTPVTAKLEAICDVGMCNHGSVVSRL